MLLPLVGLASKFPHQIFDFLAVFVETHFADFNRQVLASFLADVANICRRFYLEDHQLFIKTNQILNEVFKRLTEAEYNADMNVAVKHWFDCIWENSPTIKWIEAAETIVETLTTLLKSLKKLPEWVVLALPNLLPKLTTQNHFKGFFIFLNAVFVFGAGQMHQGILPGLLTFLLERQNCYEKSLLTEALVLSHGKMLGRQELRAILIVFQPLLSHEKFEVRQHAARVFFAVLAAAEGTLLDAEFSNFFLNFVSKFCFDQQVLFSRFERRLGVVALCQYLGNKGLASGDEQYVIAQSIIFLHNNVKFLQTSSAGDNKNFVSLKKKEESEDSDDEEGSTHLTLVMNLPLKLQQQYIEPVQMGNEIVLFNQFVKDLSQNKQKFDQILRTVPSVMREYITDMSKSIVVCVDKKNNVMEARKIIKLKKNAP